MKTNKILPIVGIIIVVVALIVAGLFYTRAVKFTSDNERIKGKINKNNTPTGFLPLGIGISSREVLDFYNSKALSTDIALAGSSFPAQLDLLKAAKGIKVLLLNPDTAKVTQEMDTAKTSGFLVSGNIEDPNLNNTLSKQKEQYQLAKSKGLTYIFGPAGIMLRDSYSA